MKNFLLLAPLLMASVVTAFAGDTVELNGMTSLFGENIAFMLLHQQGPAAPVSFYLLQGQSRHGIKLLAVDVANRRVQIERDGQTQYMRLSAAPDLTVPDEPAMVIGRRGGIRHIIPAQQAQLDQFLNQDPDVQKIISGQPIFTGAYVGAPLPGPGSSGNSSGGSSTGNSSSGSNSGSDSSGSTAANNNTGSQSSSGSSNANSPVNANSTPATSASATKPDYTQQPWYQLSQAIERNRLNTAPQVMIGEMEPLPRTPLTPPNTPPILIGADTYFANRISNFSYVGPENGWSNQD
jgi:hypothetical protein